MINSKTKMYASFSKKPGDLGCKLFSAGFEYYDLNCIYKSFYVHNIKQAVEAAKCLQFSGFAVSMPFKRDILKYVCRVSDEVKKIGAANTVVQEGAPGNFVAHNTDYVAAKIMIKRFMPRNLVILGDGGYAAAIKYAANEINCSYDVITRSEWPDISRLENKTIFNATPVENISIGVSPSNIFIDCVTSTKTGKQLARLQAAVQFKLYTGFEFPIMGLKNEK